MNGMRGNRERTRISAASPPPPSLRGRSPKQSRRNRRLSRIMRTFAPLNP
ncbi:MAG: hypothetical protein LBT00_08745 [Spirochaetaceae bacterium]|nr:hypothetical protein [Spirochaetaceae bacterium]